MTKAILKGWLYLPYEAVANVGELREQLTHQPRPGMDGKRRDPVYLFNDMPSRRLIGVPQAFGRRAFPEVEIIDRTSDGEEFGPVPYFPQPDHPAVKDPAAQAQFMQDMMTAVDEHGTFIAQAPTGTGKTVVGLKTAGLIGRKTCVVVHLARLRDQWVREARDKLGLPMSRIGVVEGGMCEWRGKSIVVAMLQSLAYKPGRYGREFYNSFGTVIFDEVHRIGAPVFSRVAYQFPARVRFGMSATAYRKDKGAKVFHWHLGPIAVTSRQAALPMQVWTVWYDCGRYKLWGRNHGARMSCLSRDERRNERICALVVKMYNGGRQAIVVAEAVKHLQHLMALCERAGVPRSDMGQFTNEIHYTEKVEQPDGRMQPVAKKRKQKPAALTRVQQESRIIFATYGMIKEGIDIPRLDAGIDATPRGDAAQLIGRIRRPHEGKKEPVIWVTIVDSQCDRSLRYYQGRLADYNKTGAEVKNGST